MSYDILIFAASSKETHLSGVGLDEFEHEVIADSDRAVFIDRLQKYGFERVGGEGAVGRFEHRSQQVAVAVRESEISFMASFDGEAVFEALMTASELCDGDALALFDPQVGEWN